MAVIALHAHCQPTVAVFDVMHTLGLAPPSSCPWSAEVQAALEGLMGVYAVGVTREVFDGSSGAPGFDWIVTFYGPTGDVPSLGILTASYVCSCQ